MRLLLPLLLLLWIPVSAQPQNNFKRIFQFSLTPGLSTNGLHQGGYSNYASINLTSGYSAASYLFELDVISNFNVNETRGLQLAGIANITGGNAFAAMRDREIDLKVRQGFEANATGAQFSGFANVVLNNVFGWQATGGFNLSKGALIGFQMAGISNTVYKYSFGAQLAGLYNVSAQSMDGVQVAALFNVTEGELYGCQVSAFNRAGVIEGVNTYPETDAPTGVQAGLVNLAKKMNGFQIGLVNYGGRMQGTQIGLINIFNGGRDPLTRNGTAVGLVNVGEAFYLSAYASDLFMWNVELATGTAKNRRMTTDPVEKRLLNSLIYSCDPGFLSDRQQWALGYGIKKFYLNRSQAPGMNTFRYISFGVDWMHINHAGKKISRELSLLARPNIAVGSRLHPKNRNFFFFLSGSYNFYASESSRDVEGLFSSAGPGVQHWPGFAAGVLVQ